MTEAQADTFTEARSAGNQSAGAGDCLLLVDDNPTNLQVLYQTLDRRGNKLLIAKNGELALSIARKANPALILLDIMMPGIDGYEVCRQLKEDPETSNIAIIFLSALDDTSDKVRGLDLGAVDYISKPFHPEEVIARVDNHLKIRRLERNLSRRNKELKAANDRMKGDLEAAAKVQRALLPTDPPRAGNSVFAWESRSCDELGGDSLNLFNIDDRYVGMYVLDVCGHGVPAALLAFTVTHTLSSDRSLLVEEEEADGERRIISPAVVAARLNGMFQMDSRSLLYFTFLYGVLDTHTWQFRFISAGIPGPLIVHRDGMTEVHDIPAVPIGLLEDSDYQDTILDLKPGDRLYMHSDGIMEERNADREEFGRDRIRKLLSSSRNISLDTTLNLLLGEVETWHGSESLSDDATIAAIEVRD